MILAIAIILTIMLGLVIFFDVWRFIIPNWLNLAFILLYPVFLIFYPGKVEWWYSLAVMFSFLVVGMLIFSFNLIGGGDVKLMVALSLWIGWNPQTLILFGAWTAIAGGVLALFLVIVRWYFIMLGARMKKLPVFPKMLRWSEPMPYGLAIAYAFGYLLWTGNVFDIPGITPSDGYPRL